ncbi:MAG TPA: hypothetical protein VH301_14685 [Usitatibacter sp.]|nr:hypothetical protein [Usitatibacter sp.]
MKIFLLACALCVAGCAYDPPDSLEYQARTLHTESMDAAIKAAKPGEPRCDEACRARAANPG